MERLTWSIGALVLGCCGMRWNLPNDESRKKPEGSVPDKPMGKYKFGWDPVFIPKGYSKTFGEMGPEEKNKISMRKIALEKLRKFLESI